MTLHRVHHKPLVLHFSNTDISTVILKVKKDYAYMEILSIVSVKSFLPSVDVVLGYTDDSSKS